MGDINFPDLGDFLFMEGSQILARSSGDNGLIEKQMDLPTFPVNYTWRLYIILSRTGTPPKKTGWGRNLKTGFLGLLCGGDEFDWKGSIPFCQISAKFFPTTRSTSLRPQSVQCGTRANRKSMTSQDLSKESEGASLNKKEPWI